MNPGVQSVICGRHRVPVTKTFTSNATWVAPTTTSRISTAVGLGAPGTPSTLSSAYDEYMTHDVYYHAAFVSSTGPVFQGHFTGPTPNDYIVQTTDPSDYTNFDQFIYHFVSNPNGHPATTGASATAFAQTFPGGTGGPGTPTTLTNLVVTPGASYNIVVPAGGSLTITYSQ